MVKIIFYNLSVYLETDDYILANHINNFLNTYYTIKSNSFTKNISQEVKVFCIKVKEQPIYYFHTNQFIHLYNYLTKINYPLTVDIKEDRRDYKIQPADYTIREGWKLRDYQVPVYEFLINDPTKSKLVPLQTGQGKTSIALFSVASLKQRLGIVILPVYIEKWIFDITNIHEAKVEDVMVIQGSKSLKALIELAKTDSLTNNYYIFSSRTLQEYIAEYEEDPDLCYDMYGCYPIELFPLLGIGVLLIDETHQHFHAIYRILLQSNVKYQIGLSATLLSDNSIVRRTHLVVYPDKQVYQNSKLEKYTDVYAVAYTLSSHLLKFIKTTNYGSSNYSHIAFEQSILKRDFLLDYYIKIILSTIEDYYIADYKDGDKLLIFVSTVKLATTLTEKFKDIYPKYIVNRYCEDDSFDNLNNSDIIVSTVISAGTAVDIKNLRVVIQTVSISSQVANIQSLGRLRRLADRDVKFCYLYCENIDKHKFYHTRRVELFKDRVATINYRKSRI